MYIVTSIDGLYVERQVATYNPVTAKEIFIEWAQEFGMYVGTEEERCVLGNKEIFITEIALNRKSNIVLVITHKYPEHCSMEAYTFPDLAMRMYLQTLEHIFKNESDVDNEGNDFIDAIIEIMESYKIDEPFNDSVWFYNTSVTFRTLKIV